jgi:hypothetical protein
VSVTVSDSGAIDVPPGEGWKGGVDGSSIEGELTGSSQSMLAAGGRWWMHYIRIGDALDRIG